MDLPEGIWGGIYLGAGFCRIKLLMVEGAVFEGFGRFACGFWMVNSWCVDGGLW
jgi:hypothetical protein